MQFKKAMFHVHIQVDVPCLNEHRHDIRSDISRILIISLKLRGSKRIVENRQKYDVIFILH